MSRRGQAPAVQMRVDSGAVAGASVSVGVFVGADACECEGSCGCGCGADAYELTGGHFEMKFSRGRRNCARRRWVELDAFAVGAAASTVRRFSASAEA
eukprot:6116795-Pleurochrysis_carterae.AAC.1